MPTFRLSHAGYGNEVNICFVNSILQFLACIPVIKAFFGDKIYKTCDSRNYPLCSEISGLFGFSGSRQIQSAGVLRTTLGSMPGLSRFKDGKQQDAIDFFHMLLTKIESEVGCALIPSILTCCYDDLMCQVGFSERPLTVSDFCLCQKVGGG